MYIQLSLLFFAHLNHKTYFAQFEYYFAQFDNW